MDPTLRARIVVLSDLPCAGGEYLFDVPYFINDGSGATRRMDGRHQSALLIPRTETWARQIRERMVLHTSLANGLGFDWRVSKIEDGVNNGSPVTLIVADPAEVELSDCGPIRFQTPGGGTSYTFTYTKETIEEIFERILLPSLSTYGINYVELGDIGPQVQLTGAGDMVTHRALIKTFEDATGAFFVYERVGNTGYLIHLRYEINPGVAPARVSQGLNFIDLTRVRGREDLATVIIVRGKAVNGIRGPLGLAMWRVADVQVSDVAPLETRQVATFATAGTFSWTAPANMVPGSLVAECWGGGGGEVSGLSTRRAGAGGGAYARGAPTVTPGDAYDVVVGAAGTFSSSGSPARGGTGGTSMFDDGSEVLAVGGQGSGTISTFGAGGAAGSCVGAIAFSGGAGGLANSGAGGGAGGGSGFPARDGYPGAGAASGLVALGGAGFGRGGKSGPGAVVGESGMSGGGGAGGSGAMAGGAIGGVGFVRLTWEEEEG